MSPIVQITRGKCITKWIIGRNTDDMFETHVDMGEIALNVQLFRSWRHAYFQNLLDSDSTLLFPVYFSGMELLIF